MKPNTNYLPENIAIRKNRELKFQQDQEFIKAKEEDNLRKIEEETYREYIKNILTRYENLKNKSTDLKRIKIRTKQHNEIITLPIEYTINDLLELLCAKFLNTVKESKELCIILKTNVYPTEFNSEYRIAYTDIPVIDMLCFNVCVEEKEIC